MKEFTTTKESNRENPISSDKSTQCNKHEEPKYPHLFPTRSVIPVPVGNKLVMNIDIVVNFSIAPHSLIGLVGPQTLEFLLFLVMYFARNISSGLRIEVIISK